MTRKECYWLYSLIHLHLSLPLSCGIIWYDMINSLKIICEECIKIDWPTDGLTKCTIFLQLKADMRSFARLIPVKSNSMYQSYLVTCSSTGNARTDSFSTAEWAILQELLWHFSCASTTGLQACNSSIHTRTADTVKDHYSSSKLEYIQRNRDAVAVLQMASIGKNVNDGVCLHVS